MAAVSLCSANAWSQDANTWSQDANAWSQDRGGAKAETAKENEIPPLSLSSLYRPDARHRYASTLPPLSWMETAEDEFVLVRRAEDQWEILDPQSGETSEWTFPELLTEAVLGEDLFFEDSAASIKPPSSPVAKDASAKETSADGTDDASAEDAERDREAAKRRRAGRLVNRYLRSMTSTFRPTLWTFGKRLLLVRPDRLRKINDDADDDVASAGVFDVLAMDASAFRDAALSPDGRRLGYSRNGDLYVMDTQNGAVTRLTDDGLETLLDGRLDWTYQEEIFGRGNFKAFWFSPDGKQVAALRIDTSSVPEYFLAHSRDPRGAGPVVRYPKAGDPIPHATLLIYDIDSGTSRAFHQSTPQAQRIITGVWWHPHSGDLLYTVSDRVQSWRELHRVVAGQPASQLVLREESPAWVEPPESPLFFADGSFLWRSEVATGKGRVFHVARDGRSVVPISPVNFHVRSMAMDADAKFVLVTGDASIIGNGQHVYRIALASGDGESATPPGELAEMVQLTRGDGWHAPSFRPDGGALVDSHSSVDMPTRRSWISCPADTRSFEIDAVELNLPGGLQPSQVLTIPAKDGYPLPAVIHPPLGDVPASGAPLLVEIYGGPQSASASNRWRETTRLYREWLNRRGVGVLVVDNRSSAARGSGDSWPIAGQFGAIELDDTLAAVNWLQNHRDWVDADRIAINGWSFGGYMVTYAMTHSDVFAAGIAGGSVTDWREYDAFYTERYMGLPQTNPDGYRAGGVLASANKLSGDLLLIHGEVDDNVHPTGTLRLADRLQRAGIPFDLMIYTSAAHGVRDPNQVWHLRQTIDRFLTRSLDLAEIASDSHSRGGGDSETRKTP